MGGGGAAVPLPPNEDFGADGATRRMQRMTPRSRRKLGRSLSVEQARALAQEHAAKRSQRKLLSAPDYGLSWSDLLRFEGVTFHQAGTFKVCACDSAVAANNCTVADDFTVEVGKVHASGLQCLLAKPQFARGECISQKYGGLRCYPDGAPEATVPWDSLGVPTGMHAESLVMYGIGPTTNLFGEIGIVEKINAFCMYGTDMWWEYDFCAEVFGVSEEDMEFLEFFGDAEMRRKRARQ
jgi:hypothetical protein